MCEYNLWRTWTMHFSDGIIILILQYKYELEEFKKVYFFQIWFPSIIFVWNLSLFYILQVEIWNIKICVNAELI